MEKIIRRRISETEKKGSKTQILEKTRAERSIKSVLEVT